MKSPSLFFFFFFKNDRYTNLTHVSSQNAINVLHLKVVHVLVAMPFMYSAIQFREHAIIYCWIYLVLSTNAYTSEVVSFLDVFFVNDTYGLVWQMFLTEKVAAYTVSQYRISIFLVQIFRRMQILFWDRITKKKPQETVKKVSF